MGAQVRPESTAGWVMQDPEQTIADPWAAWALQQAGSSVRAQFLFPSHRPSQTPETLRAGQWSVPQVYDPSADYFTGYMRMPQFNAIPKGQRVKILADAVGGQKLSQRRGR